MTTSIDFIEYVCEQIASAGSIRYKKMFGEYLVYVNERPALLVCDNTVFIKDMPCLRKVLLGAERGFPYNGAKEHYILDIDDREKAKTAAVLIAHNTPLHKKKSSEVTSIKQQHPIMETPRNKVALL